MIKSCALRASEKLKKHKRTVGSSFAFLRKIEFKRNRLSGLGSLKYSARRNSSYMSKMEHDLFWNCGVDVVSAHHKTNYVELVKRLVVQAKKGGRKAVIVEFGPGEGNAINELSKTTKDATFYDLLILLRPHGLIILK
jgi:hypothetical protein